MPHGRESPRSASLVSVAGGLLGLTLALASLSAAVPAAAQQGEAAAQRAWLDGVKREAVERGISPGTVEAALDGWQPLARVIELDRRQPEFTQTFWSYIDRAVSERRIERGRALLARHEPLLRQIQRHYGIQPRFLVAIWGLESNFGSNTGGFPVVDALTTLAYDPRRSDFFRSQLFDALRIVDQGHIKLEAMNGSWAGAMGQVQFMPETFRRHAVDQDGDKRRDIWTSLPDAFGSAANYLRALKWRGGETWGREVRLPNGFDWDLANLEVRKPIGEWQRLGVRTAAGRDLPRADIEGSIILPGGHRGPAFLVYQNFRAILQWNRSLFYAVAVGHLSDRIDGRGALVAGPVPGDRPMSRAEITEMQRLLLALGYKVGEPDGVIGSKTRAALRGFQQSARLPADGYPTPALLESLRRAQRTSGG